MLPALDEITQLEVRLSKASYPIYIGSNILTTPSLISKVLGQQLLVITNAEIAQYYLTPYLAALAAQYPTLQIDSLLLPSGEQAKSFTAVETVINALAKQQHRRDTTLIALGGGVIGDIVGFCAACYMRGVAYIQYPTSLLAQVDAAVGGKTAINHPLGKNLIGFFHQPKAVVIDLNTLTTLPEREFRAGLAEVIKYGVALDPPFLNWVEQNLTQLLQRSGPWLQAMVGQALSIKAKIVAQDEYDQNLRLALNFGHTLGHALETQSGYQTLLHGEAVGIGMLGALYLSETVLGLAPQWRQRVQTLLQQIGLPITLPKAVQFPALLATMQLDKKALQQQVRWVLTEVGCPQMVEQVTPAMLENMLTALVA